MSRFVQALIAVTALSAAVPNGARAFCGFFVSGAEASLYNEATMVVLMREGTRTVLSMQNSYKGPPEDFALVIPVPVILQKQNVKTLPDAVFKRVDTLSAPRLVEYWETDPCRPQVYPMAMAARQGVVMEKAKEDAPGSDLGVRVEAKFAVGEYDIVILSARDSNGLDTWLRQEHYNIPKGAGAVLRPYVEAGTKFFVAKVDVKRVRFADGHALLSPIRFYYDDDEFSLPVRLGLLNSAGQQDLIVQILARGQRYEVANYDNVAIPTNIRVDDAVRSDFGGFYDALFRKTTASHPGAVVTEYAWDAGSCDPCPSPPLQGDELMTLGADVVGAGGGPTIGPDGQPIGRGVIPPTPNLNGFVLTRLHYRYDKDQLGRDLVFRVAKPIVGGRGTPDARGELPERAPQPSSVNNFQGRYVILHPWEGAVACENPIRGQWGGPPGSGGYRGGPAPVQGAAARVEAGRPASKPVSFERLASLVRYDIPAIDLTAKAEAQEPKQTPAAKSGGTPTPKPGGASAPKSGGAELSTHDPATTEAKDAGSKSGCALVWDGGGSGAPALWVGGALALLALSRRRRRRT
ncbi:MAG: DUF2330 domain-containing protein [Myxococcales bacterium]|nr:DUF2330 domain-containing protein [Myxococcales bacterium]